MPKVTMSSTKTKKNRLTGRTKTTTKKYGSDGSTSKTVEKRRKDGSLKKRVTKTRGASDSPFRKPVKTKDVQKQSKSGRRVVVKNKTTEQSRLAGINKKRTVKSKTVLKAQKARKRRSEEGLLFKKQTVKRTVGRKVTGKSKSKGDTTTRNRSETMRGYTEPKKIKLVGKREAKRRAKYKNS